MAQKQIALDYNDDGQLSSIARYLDGQLTVQADYAYDDAARLVGLVCAHGGATLASYAWTYSASGSPLLLDDQTNTEDYPKTKVRNLTDTTSSCGGSPTEAH